MNLIRRKRAALLSLLLLVGLMAVLCGLTWRAWRQAKLNRDLLIAISKNDLRATQRLLSAGADANAPVAPVELNLWQLLVNTLRRRSASKMTDAPASLMMAFAAASTPMQDAAGGNRLPPEPVAMVQLLQQNGAKPNGRYSDGSALLLMPIAHEWTECVKLMLDAGADPNATDKYGLPVLRVALLLGDTKTVQVLIEKHANINWKDASGNTPISIATVLHDSKTLRLLKQAGARK